MTAADGSYSFTQLGPRQLHRAGSGSGRLDANGRQRGYTVSATSGSNSSGNDFANFANISISGTKYNDQTGNGITGDDTGLGGVTINLYLNGNPTPVASTVTAADGSYSFSNLGPGTYTVQEVVPAGSTQTAGNAGYTVSATSGTNSSGNNFANFANITISGTKFNDITGNSFTGDDVGLGGVTINLYLNGNPTPVASTVTAADGSYSFTNSAPAATACRKWFRPVRRKPAATRLHDQRHQRHEFLGQQFRQLRRTSRSAAPSTTTSPATAITGDDTGLGGVTINLYLNGNPTPVASTVTAADGSYSFTNLGPGSYTRAGRGSGRFDANGRQRRLHDQRHQRHEFLGQQLRQLPEHLDQRHQVQRHHRQRLHWRRRRPGRRDRQSVSQRRQSTPVASTVTAADGSYSFTNLGPGSYTVQEVVPAGSTQTAGNAGYTISATSGSNSSGNNFDNFPNISISGTKYNDHHRQRASADDDTPLGRRDDQSVSQRRPTPVASTVTAADGSYSFTNLGPGTYSVQEEVPAGSTQTGGIGGYTIVAHQRHERPPATTSTNFTNISISGTKYNDITGNSFTGDDTGLGGVTINLYKNGSYARRSLPRSPPPTARTASPTLAPARTPCRKSSPAGSTQTGGIGGYTSAPPAAEFLGQQLRRLPEHLHQRHEVQRHTGNGFSRRRHRPWAA